MHNASLPERTDEIVEPRDRLVLLVRRADVSFAELERAQGLGRGVISSYVGRRLYAYPRLQDAVCVYLAAALDADEAEIREYLFPFETGGPP